MAPTRVQAPPAASGGVNILSSSFYASGGGIPEGNWALFFDAIMHKGEKEMGEEKLKIRVTAYNLDAPTDEPKIGLYSMGGKAHKSFAPNATGKGVIPIPNGPAMTANDKTNWALLFRSMLDCGMPDNLGDSFEAIDGVWAHLTHVPEPEERKGFGAAQTGEAGMNPEEKRGNFTIAVVSEILEGGKPWEGGGGVPEAAAPKAAVKAGPKAAPKPMARPTPVKQDVAVVEAEEGDGDELLVQAIEYLTPLLVKSPNGAPKLALKMDFFKKMKAAGVDPQPHMDAFFADDEGLNKLVSQVNYIVKGAMVVPA